MFGYSVSSAGDVNGQFQESLSIPPSGRWTPKYGGSANVNGPLEVKSAAVLETAGGQSNTPGIPIFFTSRTLYYSSFSETNGFPANQLVSEYWFPWYDYSILQTWLAIGRPCFDISVPFRQAFCSGECLPCFRLRA